MDRFCAVVSKTCGLGHKLDKPVQKSKKFSLNKVLRRNKLPVATKDEISGYTSRGTGSTDEFKNQPRIISFLKINLDAHQFVETKTIFNKILKSSIDAVFTTVNEGGEDLFKRVFNYDASFKEKIKIQRNYSAERVDSLFSTHSIRVLRIVKQLIYNINDPQFAHDELSQLGRTHKGFRVDSPQMDVMLTNFLDLLERFDWQNWNSASENAWMKFIAGVFSLLTLPLETSEAKAEKIDSVQCVRVS
ncbi:hypothetical protein ACOME3_007725 [Neoechinorhynchus agilis]